MGRMRAKSPKPIKRARPLKRPRSNNAPRAAARGARSTKATRSIKSGSPKDTLTFDDLLLIVGGHTASQLLWAGHCLGLFPLLAKEPGLTIEAIAERLNLAPNPARILLVGLTTLRVILKVRDGYKNARVTERLLPGSRSFAPVLGWQMEIVYPGLLDFLPSLKENRNVGLRRVPVAEPGEPLPLPSPGESLYRRLQSYPRVEKVFQDAMSALSNQANTELLDVIPLRNSRHLVDVGGGAATNVLALAQRFRDLRLTVFDSPTVCELANQNIERAGLGNRISTHPGDIFTDDLPAGVDAILFCHMFTIWSPDEAKALIRKSHAALPRGGKLLIFNMMGNDDDRGPITTALGSPYFLAVANGKGRLYSWQEHETRLSEAGFSRLERVADLPFDHGLLIATK